MRSFLFIFYFFFFFTDTATPEIYTTANTLSLHDALPISLRGPGAARVPACPRPACGARSEEHTSELQSLAVISYAVFCLKKKKSIHSATYVDTLVSAEARHKRVDII